jgi:hypothetical protein
MARTIVKASTSWAPEAQACNPSYLRGRDKEDRTNSLGDPISKKPNTKKGLVEWIDWYSACLASVKPQVQTPILPTKKQHKQPPVPIHLLKKFV